MTDEFTVTEPDNAEAKAAAEQAEQDADGCDDVEWIGFVGCPQVGLLKVRVHSRNPAAMRVACTCGEEHVTSSPMVRARQPGEVVTLIEEGMPMQVPAPASDGVNGRRQVSDQAIADAVPPGSKPLLTELAAALGYGGTGPLLRRLRRMNAAAEKADKPAPFKLTKLEWRGMTVERING